MPKSKQIDFEASLGRLEQLVDQLEEGELSLEDSLKAFEQGVKLTRECQEALRKAEQKVNLLLQDNGDLVAEPFDTESLEED